MSKTLAAVIALLASMLITPASAITGGKLDGNLHPYGALILVPKVTFCSGTLIDEAVVLTAGHCAAEFSASGLTEVWVTFDSKAAVDPQTWAITGGNWYRASVWTTHPNYAEADWPFTADYGVVVLDDPVSGITPASLPEAGLLNPLIGSKGQTRARFTDVGYGQDGVNVGGGPYTRNYSFIRKYTEQRYNPSVGAVGTLDPMWLTLGSTPSANRGGGCGGDSGSGIYVAGTNTVVAVHTGGYDVGYDDRLCARMTALNHRVDLPVVLDWLADFLN